MRHQENREGFHGRVRLHRPGMQNTSCRATEHCWTATPIFMGVKGEQAIAWPDNVLVHSVKKKNSNCLSLFLEEEEKLYTAVQIIMIYIYSIVALI